MLTSRYRRPITRKKIHKIIRADLTQVMKNDGAQPCDNTDEYKVKGPFAGKSDIDVRLFVGSGYENLFKTA